MPVPKRQKTSVAAFLFVCKSSQNARMLAYERTEFRVKPLAPVNLLCRCI